MKIFTGIDILNLSRFRESFNRSGQKFFSNIFHADEIEENLESMAGKFAAKEAVKKALGKEEIEWLDLKIIKKNSKPVVEILKTIKYEIISSDISISHDSDFVAASAVILTE